MVGLSLLVMMLVMMGCQYGSKRDVNGDGHHIGKSGQDSNPWLKPTR